MYNATKADNFVNAAMRFKGQWYLWGGGHGGEMKKPGRVDCSGLVQQAGFKADMNLVGNTVVQQHKGRAVGMKHLKPGDLVFRGNPSYHVGIYIGHGKVLHAPQTGKRVQIVDVGYFQYARRLFKGLGDQAKQQLKDLNTRFKKADANHDGQVAGAELKDAKALRKWDHKGAIGWQTVKGAFTKANSY
jgi:hypothetical protein